MRDPSEEVVRREGPTDPEPTWPHPPRHRWLRRLTLAFGCAGLRMFWDREAKRRLGRELEQIIAPGEPVRFRDRIAEVGG